jgi:hypothetical protein
LAHRDPLPFFTFTRVKDLYLDTAVENEDYVQCKECLQHGWDFRFRNMVNHCKKVHGMTKEEYTEKHGSPTKVSGTLERRKKTVKEKYGVENVFQLEDVKDKSRKTHKEDVVSFYGDCGIFCLVVWESELRKNGKRTFERIQKFLSRGVV